MKTSYKKFLLPALFGFLIVSFYILVIPGSIKSDASEYDKLANSILVGQFSIDGVPSMQREPGYPFFRAEIKSFTSNPEVIRWIQALLYALIIFIVGMAGSKIDFRLGSWSAWGAALSYGLAFYPATHLSEILTAFLLALTGLALLYGIEKPSFKNWIITSVLSSLLILTRYTYVLLPLAGIVILVYVSKKNKIETKKIIRNVLVSIIIVFSFVTPWIVRNYRTFNEVNVAGRSGAILYARAWRANKPWRTIPDSYLSVLLGRGLLFTVYPNNQSIWLEQWGDWWRNKEIVKQMWGTNPIEIDQKRKAEAFNLIFKNWQNMAKFAVWTGVDELRLLELPNPLPQALGSPFEGTYGPLAKEGQIPPIALLGLGLVHLTQLLWFVAIGLSTFIGFKKYGLKFVPGILLSCLLLPHAIADNIARYSAPLQPWLLSAIFMTIFFPIYERYKIKMKWKTNL